MPVAYQAYQFQHRVRPLRQQFQAIQCQVVQLSAFIVISHGCPTDCNLEKTAKVNTDPMRSQTMIPQATYIITITGQLAYIVQVLATHPIDLLQYLALRAVCTRIAQWPLGLIVVSRLHNIVEGRDLHVTVQWHDFVLFENSIDFAEANALLGVQFVDICVFAVQQAQRKSNDLFETFRMKTNASNL
jgi:hypothetical protein